MQVLSNQGRVPPGVGAGQDPEDWVAALTSTGPERDDALRRLHALMVRAARHQVWRMRSMLPGAGAGTVDELANCAADEAMTALLAKLGTFAGRSRFTTWAYKFAILQAATEVRRQTWAAREVALDDVDRWSDAAPGPQAQAEAADLAAAVRQALDVALTAYQRRIAIALLVDEVPVDVLAQRLGTSRNTLYKALHDARNNLRAHLIATGHLRPANPTAGAR